MIVTLKQHPIKGTMLPDTVRILSTVKKGELMFILKAENIIKILKYNKTVLVCCCFTYIHT